MTQHTTPPASDRLAAALAASDSSARLQVALAAGMQPHHTFIDVLVDRCAAEPDFYVRDMLTWALTRHDKSAVTRRLLRELDSQTAQARSQALHTLSKIGDRHVWPAITTALLQDADDEVARTAWRTAAGLVPAEAATGLATTLATQLGRGGRDLQLSLSRAFVTIGSTASAVLERAATDRDPRVRIHAVATTRLIADPETGFDAAIDEARRTIALLNAPVVKQ
ncbi:HEAT repeat domain-containing protein [Blastococcus sp. Marseille-P5729]|uniref:HEAT repeat domain-containing protein n=1 Tax=Blastococcus sp. Marseille-P5729 TaxID=2086582 RepID=UPI000D0FA0B4|nr:HEAT repeat domain-containing protein [Blastococcus sp. Marseille-P5729]